MPHSTFKQSDLTRAIKACKNAGCNVDGAIIEPDGKLKLHFLTKGSDSVSYNLEANEDWDKKLGIK